MLNTVRAAAVATLAVTGASASLLSQGPFTKPHFTSLEDSSVRVLTHESHPKHSLTIVAHGSNTPSIKSGGSSLTDVCPGATSGYTGYLNSGSKHFYFAYFESRSKPTDDPLVLWLNGGPGCSSMTGLFMELGPCIVDETGESARENPHSVSGLSRKDKFWNFWFPPTADLL